MSHRIYALTAVAAYGLTLAAAQASATTYDFSTVLGQVTSPTTTLNGATFSSPSDSATGGTFTFGPNAGLYTNMGPYVLSSTGNAVLGVSTELDVSFSQAQTGLSFSYAIGDFLQSNGGDTLTVKTNTGFTETLTNAAIPAGTSDLYPQGLFNLAAAAPFTSVQIFSSDSAGVEDLAIADMTSTPVPLPASVWLFASAIAGFGLKRIARRAA